MYIKIDGNIKPYYVQTLVLLFLPGETFSQSEDENSEKRLYVKLYENNSHISISAEAFVFDHYCNFTESCAIGDDSEKSASLLCGRVLYRLFGSMLGFYPPWGTLTGVRPTKLATKVLNSGEKFDDAVDYYKNNYLSTDKKARLATTCSINEEKIIKSVSDDECSLYISIPFCPTRCAYCSFVSYATPRLLSLIPDYLQKLYIEISEKAELIRMAGKKVCSVYVGGGTPSILTAEQISELIAKINSALDYTGRSDNVEFTFEGGRPDTITSDKLLACAAGGVNRISINPQSTSDKVLRAIGRSHTAKDFFTAFEMAEKSGIRCINTDLIVGLPEDSYESFCKTIDDIVSLNVQNITVHSFSVKRSASIKENAGCEIYKAESELANKCVDYSCDKLTQKGFIPYYLYRQKNTVGNLENVGWSLPGYEGRYNIFIMEEIHSIYACGAGAVTKIVQNDSNSKDGLKIERFFNPKYPYEYLNVEKAQ